VVGDKVEENNIDLGRGVGFPVFRKGRIALDYLRGRIVFQRDVDCVVAVDACVVYCCVAGHLDILVTGLGAREWCLVVD